MGDGVREGHLSFSSTSATPSRTRQDAPMPPPRSDTYERLLAYMAERMRMSPIDQPLMLMELLGRRSPAPAQDVARRILGEDVPQIDYTTELVKRMVGKVLTGNGITALGNGAYSLIGGDELSDGERDGLLELCCQRLDAFREQRGEEVFAHRRGPLRGRSISPAGFAGRTPGAAAG